jgi:RimJ/RimL family protein N-acetyltransferase
VTEASLRLRSWTTSEADLDFLFDMYARPDVRRWIGDGRVMTDREQARALVGRWRGLADGVLGVRAIESSAGERLGSILLKPIPRSTGAARDEADAVREIEIGWHLHPRAWGRGIATTAARGVLAEARTAGIVRVVAVTHPDNIASQRVCARLGMVPRGLTRRYYDTTCALFETVQDATPVESADGLQPV